MMVMKDTRVSPAGQSFDYEHDGIVKIRLGHTEGASVFIPDFVFFQSGNKWRFLKPSMFDPVILAFNLLEDGIHRANLSVDVTRPEIDKMCRMKISFCSDGMLKRYEDGAFLYKCTISGPRKLTPYSAGECEREEGGDFKILLFHHTNAIAYNAIQQSQELWSSAWNIQGERRLKNISYVYFTSLKAVHTEEHLRRIAMSGEAKISFQTTSDRIVEEVLTLKVYREQPSGRKHSISIKVPTRAIAPSHLRLHPATRNNFAAYYEVVGPEIFRVGLLPQKVLKFQSRECLLNSADIKRFEYVIVGPTDTTEGLMAPFDEEETKHLMHIEKCEGSDIFEFWYEHPNTDQISGRSPELIEIENAGAL